MIVDATRPLGTPAGPIVERESFERVVKTGKPAIGSIARGASGTWAVPVRVPVIRDGNLRYVLTAVVKVDGIREVLDRQRLPNDWVASVFDAKGMRAARSRQHDEFIAREPSAIAAAAHGRQRRSKARGTTQALEGDTIYTAYSRSPETNWTVAIGIPVGLIDTAVRRSLATYGTGILLSIVLGALAAVFIGRSIARPIDELRAAAEALGRREAVRAARDGHRRDPPCRRLAPRRRRRACAQRGGARRSARARAAGARHRRGRQPLEGRVPRDARPRAAQSARRRSPTRASCSQIGDAEAQRARARRDRAPGAAPRAHDRRSPRRGPRHDRQDDRCSARRSTSPRRRRARVSTLRASGRVGGRRLALTAQSGLGRRRPDPCRADLRQPARQRDQVHAGRRLRSTSSWLAKAMKR